MNAGAMTHLNEMFSLLIPQRSSVFLGGEIEHIESLNKDYLFDSQHWGVSICKASAFSEDCMYCVGEIKASHRPKRNHFNVCNVLSAAKACWEHALNWALGLQPASCQNGEITKCAFAGNDYSLWLGLSVSKVSRVSLWTIRSIVSSWYAILLAPLILWPKFSLAAVL